MLRALERLRLQGLEAGAIGKDASSLTVPPRSRDIERTNSRTLDPPRPPFARPTSLRAPESKQRQDMFLRDAVTLVCPFSHDQVIY